MRGADANTRLDAEPFALDGDVELRFLRDGREGLEVAASGAQVDETRRRTRGAVRIVDEDHPPRGIAWMLAALLLLFSDHVWGGEFRRPHAGLAEVFELHAIRVFAGDE